MFDFVTGDTGSSLSVPCTDSNGDVIDLTGCSVELHWKDASGAAVVRNMTIDDETGGICSYKFADGEIFAPAMSFEVQITDAGGFIITTPDLMTVTVRKELA